MIHLTSSVWFVFLRYLLMRFLTRVSHNSESNLMNSESLGIVFGPTILRPLVEDQKTLTDRTNTMVVTRMIEYYDEVFQR